MATQYPIGDQIEGAEVTLSVTVNSDATPPVQYQWFQDNVAIPGEVGPIYTFIVEQSDANAVFTVLVQNPCGQAVSEGWLMGDVAPPPQDCPEYATDAYEQAILNYATVINPSGHVWLMDDPLGSTFVEGSSGVNLTENLQLTYAVPSILDGGSSAIHYDSVGSAGRARTSALPLSNTSNPTGFISVLGQNVSPQTEPGNFFFVEHHITPGLFNAQFYVGTNGPTGLRVVVNIEGVSGVTDDYFGVVSWDGTCPSEAHVISLWYTYDIVTGGYEYILYVDHVQVGTSSGTLGPPSGAAPTVGGRLLFYCGSKDTTMSHGFYVENATKPTAAELYDLQLGLAQNCADYEPPSYCPPGPECTPYACDALYAEIVASNVQSFWPMQEPAGPTAADVVGIHDLTAGNTPVFGNSPGDWLIDTCAAVRNIHWQSNVQELQTSTSPLIGTQGTVGFILDAFLSGVHVYFNYSGNGNALWHIGSGSTNNSIQCLYGIG